MILNTVFNDFSRCSRVMVILYLALICVFLIKASVFLFFSFTVSLLSLCSVSNKHSDHTLRRGSNTLGRKQHTSPAFQPPLPPVEAPGQGHGACQVPQPSAEPQPQPQAPSGGSGPDASQHSLAQGLAALAAAQQLLAQHTEELR